MESQIASAEKAAGAALIAEGNFQRALFQFNLARMHSNELAQQAMVAVGLGPSPQALAAAPKGPDGNGGVNPTAMMGMLGGGGAAQATSDLKARALAVYVAATNNAALAQLKLNHHSAAVAMATEVLHAEPNNSKALYRRAAAKLQLRDPDAALDDLRHALTVAPDDPAIVALTDTAIAEVHAHRDKQRAAMAKMFD